MAVEIPETISIEGVGLQLVPLTREMEKDFSFLVREDVAPYFMEQIKDVKEYIDIAVTKMKKGEQVVLAILEDGVPVGKIRLFQISKENEKAAIGSLIVNPASRGRGIATKAVYLLTNAAFKWGFRTIWADVAKPSVHSLRAFVKNKKGFRIFGNRPEFTNCVNGWQDKLLLGVNKDQWGKRWSVKDRVRAWVILHL